MAVARPIRALGFVALLLFVFAVHQIFSSPRSTLGPGDKVKKGDPNDPNLDRMYILISKCYLLISLTRSSYWGA